ncbi:MAG: hypothetical protein PHP22_09285 [Oscillospiraceae bacterium]|nr:hypothetical protein [Oscillospiraceae bacterium]
MSDFEKEINNGEELLTQPVLNNRWIILLGGFLLSLMGGMSYAWGSFVIPLKDKYGWMSNPCQIEPSFR